MFVLLQFVVLFITSILHETKHAMQYSSNAHLTIRITHLSFYAQIQQLVQQLNCLSGIRNPCCTREPFLRHCGLVKTKIRSTLFLPNFSIQRNKIMDEPATHPTSNSLRASAASSGRSRIIVSYMRSYLSSFRRTLDRFQNYILCGGSKMSNGIKQFTPISVVAMSDTHSMHSQLSTDYPPGDILIHTGDITQHGTKEELEAAIAWLGSLPYEYKIVIAGNHDIGLDKNCTHRSALARRSGSYATSEETEKLIASMREHGITYLSPTRPFITISVKGCYLKIFGLPFSPLTIGPSAFLRPRTEDTWENVDSETENHYNILLSHAPPRGYLDQNQRGDHIGCDHFRAAIERAKPLAAVFGHVHEARGSDIITWEDGTSTSLYNAAMMNKDRTLSPATVFNIILPTTSTRMSSSKIRIYRFFRGGNSS